MTDNTQSRMLGKVKWFNNKSGYGFITASEGELKDKDIFVHYSTINVGNPQYKYLVQGEYIEFDLVKSQNDKHEYQATNVSGVKGGSIMCETRQLSRPSGSEDAPRSRKRPIGRPTQKNTPITNVDFEDHLAKNDGFVTVEKKKRTYKNKLSKPVEV
jgi:CspA family cold shock protein